MTFPKTMIDWTPAPKTARLLRNTCIAGWLLCLAAAATFVGATEDKNPGIEILLFVGVFPLFFGAILIFQKRKKGTTMHNLVPVLFRGVPKEFTLFFQIFFFVAWLICSYLMMREMLQKPEWPNFGISGQISFVLMAAVFYLASAGAYWSAAIEGEEMKDEPTQSN